MNPITVRFRKWAGPPGIDTRFLCELIRLATGRNTIIVDDPKINVDIQFESVYGEREIPRIESRIYRFLSSHTKSQTNSLLVNLNLKYFLQEKMSGHLRANGMHTYLSI